VPKKKIVSLQAYIMSGLRRTWSRSPPRIKVLKAAKVAYGTYTCKHCKKPHRRKDIQVDHIVPVGTFIDYNTYIERLFVGPEGLQVLCTNCHQLKTNAEATIRAAKKRQSRTSKS
jgi:5-methylcytosine-specific restriction endonuclease McrA